MATTAARPAGTIEPATVAPVNEQPAANGFIFYDQGGVTLEYYWPLDPSRNLSADETEILAYNTGDATIEFRSPGIVFTEGGVIRERFSGAWEKFPSRSSWDRIEYIQIPPSPFGGESLLVNPGEKAKLHWHMDAVSADNTSQSVAVDLTVVTKAGTERITQVLARGGGDTPEPRAVVTATPRPTAGSQPTPRPTVQSTDHDAPSGSQSSGSSVRWSFNGTAWNPSGTPPACDEPLGLQTPVDLSKVTGALWPGQQRGAYVAHGGFRFDNNVDNDAIVRAPLGSHLVQAAQYLESGTPQYLLFFSVPCGFFYRFDHVLEVPPEVAEALKDVPLGAEGDSRTSFINPPHWVDKGDVVGTSIGISSTNIFVDFGLYDVRQPNNATPDPAWADLFAADKEFGHYGVCFFDYLPGADGQTMRSLPTGKEGKTSDFCE